MKIPMMALALLAISIPAWGQAETRQTVPAAAGGAVTFAELDGTVVEARVVLQQVIQRDGNKFPVRAQNDSRLAIGPGEQIHYTLTPTSHTPRGVRTGQTITVLGRLERPGEPRNMGGGHGVWVFGNGTLTSLRTYRKGGAFRREIAFARTAEGFACAITEGFAREDGTGSIVFESPIDGVPVSIVSSKQVSSSCRVTQANQRAGGLQK